MKEAYSQLHAANRDLLTAYSIRSTNHEELVQSLKALNQVIQNTARLQREWRDNGPLGLSHVPWLCASGWRSAHHLCRWLPRVHQGQRHDSPAYPLASSNTVGRESRVVD